jgi:hypothetical protein
MLSNRSCRTRTNARQQARHKYDGVYQDKLGHKLVLMVNDGPGVFFKGIWWLVEVVDVRLYPTEPDSLGTS